MKRREFITLLGGTAATWPLAARAQQAAMPVIGWISSSAPADRARYLTAFRQGVRETGYVEGQNVAIEYRWAQDQPDRLPDLAADLVRRQVTVIAAHDTPSSIVAKAVTTTIPIVFAGGADPVKLGLVASQLGAKLFGLLHELQPGAVRVGVLVDPNYAPTQSFVSDVQAAALSIGKQIEVLEAPTGRDIDTAFAGLAQKPIDALLVGPGPFLTNRRVVEEPPVVRGIERRIQDGHVAVDPDESFDFVAERGQVMPPTPCSNLFAADAIRGRS